MSQKLDKAVARLERLVFSPPMEVAEDVAALRLVLDALKAKQPEPVTKAEREVVKAVVAQRKANSHGLSYNVLDAVKTLEAERAKAKGKKR